MWQHYDLFWGAALTAYFVRRDCQRGAVRFRSAMRTVRAVTVGTIVGNWIVGPGWSLLRP